MMAIAFASFKEAARKKLFLLVGALTLIYLVLYSLIVYYYVRDINRNAIQGTLEIAMVASQLVSILGIYFSSMLVAFLTIMASVNTVSSEVENGSIHSIITKPVTRTEYILGKYVGLALLLCVYSVFLILSVLAISSIAGLAPVRNLDAVSILRGLGFFVLQPLSILSLSILGSSSLKTITNGIVVISIYLLGLIGGMMEQIGSLIKNDTLYLWGVFSSLLSPFDVIYREVLSSLFSSLGVTNPFMGPSGISSTAPSRWMIIFIFIYASGLLLLACRRFEMRDIP